MLFIPQARRSGDDNNMEPQMAPEQISVDRIVDSGAGREASAQSSVFCLAAHVGRRCVTVSLLRYSSLWRFWSEYAVQHSARWFRELRWGRLPMTLCSLCRLVHWAL